MNNYNLFDHPFWEEAGQDCDPILTDRFQKNDTFDKLFEARHGVNEWPYSHREYYSYVVFSKLVAVSDIYQLLKQAQIYIYSFPGPRKYERKGITQFNWLAYHYAVHVLMYCSLLDVSLVLINAVYDLKLPDEKCEYNRIRNKIKSETIRNSLESIKNLIGPYKKIRNRFVHHGRIPNIIDITNSPGLYLLQMYQAQAEPIAKLRLTHRESIDALFRLEADAIINKLNDETVVVEQVIYTLFTHLQMVYSINKGQL